jgi:hypothetical protein
MSLRAEKNHQQYKQCRHKEPPSLEEFGRREAHLEDIRKQ